MLSALRRSASIRPARTALPCRPAPAFANSVRLLHPPAASRQSRRQASSTTTSSIRNASTQAPSTSQEATTRVPAAKHKKAASSTKTQLRLDRNRFPSSVKRGPPDGQAIAFSTAERYDIDALRKALWNKNLLGRGDGKDAVNLMGEAIWIPSWPLPPPPGSSMNGSSETFDDSHGHQDQNGGAGSNHPSALSPSPGTAGEAGEIFVFETGSFVSWHMTEAEALSFVREVLRGNDGTEPPVEVERYPEMQTEAMDFTVQSGETTGVKDDLIVIGTSGYHQVISEVDKPATDGPTGRDSRPLTTAIEPNPASSSSPGASASTSSGLFTPQHSHSPRKPVSLRNALPRGEDDLAARLSLSTGLARSTKLAVYEEMLEDCMDDVSSVPSLLVSNSNAPLKRKMIQKNTGRLLLIRQYLNLRNENLMDAPEIFWSHSDIEKFFKQMVRNLEIDPRLRNLNTKLDYSLQVQATLQEMESTKVSHRLEWIIIALIAAEIGLALMREGFPKTQKSTSSASDHVSSNPARV